MNQESPTQGDFGRETLRIIFRFLLLVMGCATFLLPGVINQPELSIYDEATHLDNAWRYAHFDVPQVGERISPEILSEWTCRGFYDPEVKFPDCTPPETVGDKNFPFSLSNYNTKHPPLYYVINGFVARALVLASPIDSFVTAARLANSFWMALTIIAVWYATSHISTSRVLRCTLVVISMTVPTTFNIWFSVNNDVASYALAWLVALSCVIAHRNGLVRSIRVVLAASIAACLTKGFTIGAVFGLIIVLMMQAPHVSWKAGRRKSVLLSAILGASGFTVVFWIAVNRLFKSSTPYVSPIVRAPLDGVPWGQISDQIVRFDFPIGSYSGTFVTNIEFVDHGLLLWLLGLGWLLSLAPAAALISRANGAARQLGRGLGLASMFGYPLVATMIVTFNLLDGSPGFVRVIDRYLISIIPYSILATGMILSQSNRASKLTTFGVAVGLLAVLTTYLSAYS